MLDKATLHFRSRTEHGSVRSRHAAQNGVQLVTSELFISGVFFLIFLMVIDYG